MRLFVAVEPPRDVLAHVVQSFAVARDDLRVPSIERMHLTLAFYGEVHERKVDELSARLARAARRCPPLQLQFRACGTFPKQAKRARVLWVGVAGMTADLAKLADSCAAAARRIGIDVEERTYHPHLTLGRAKARFGTDLSGEVEALSAYDGPSWLVRHIALVRSLLGPNPRYENLTTFPLGVERA